MKKIDIVIPVFNEEKALASSIASLHKFLTFQMKDFKWQIIIADNGSTDRTREIVQELLRNFSSVSFLHLDEKGRGRAVKTAWQQSRADILSYMDVDLSTNLKHFPKLIKPLAENKYDIAVGSRLLPGAYVYGRTFKRETLSRIYNFFIKFFFRTKFSDAQCGFKAVTKKVVRELLDKIRDNEWFFDSELLILAEKMGYKIYEEPVTWVDDPGSTVRILKTASGDLLGLWRLWRTKPWKIKYDN